MFQPGPDWDGPPMAVLLNKVDALATIPLAAASAGEGGGDGALPAPLLPPRPRAGEGGGGWGADGERTNQAADAATPAPAAGASPPPSQEQRDAADARLAELEAWYRANCRAEAVFVGSARAGAADAGVAAVRAWAVSRLPEGPTLYPKSMASEQPERFFVAEIIRERIFELYGQEIPYAAQVQVEEFRERGGGRRRKQKGDEEGGGGGGGGRGKNGRLEEEAGGEEQDAAEGASEGDRQQQQQAAGADAPDAVVKDYISASVLLERESQVAIVVGAGGRALRRLGLEARREVEGFLGRPVYLELTVRVAPGWRESPERLREFGYYSDLYV
jgi:hypothetical protein